MKLRNQPVAKIMFVCMLLRNAYVTMNASQTSEYLDILPPSLEHWLSQGPRAHPIPDNCVWSDDYVRPDELDDDSDSDIDENIDDEHFEVSPVLGLPDLIL